MEAEPTVPRGIDAGRLLGFPSPVPATLLTASGLLAALGLVVFGRRIVGAIERPAPVTALLACGTFALLICWMTRRLWRTSVRGRKDGGKRPGWEMWIGWGPSLGILLATFGLSWPLDRLVDWFVWLPIWVTDVLLRKEFYSGAPLEDAKGQAVKTEAQVSSRPAQRDAVPLELDGEGEDEEGVVIQRITRRRDSMGLETLEGSLLAEFAADQRTTEIYMGFCPPFAGTPQIEFEQSSGPAARISVGQVVPHGARLDIRLQEAVPAASYVGVDIYVRAELR